MRLAPGQDFALVERGKDVPGIPFLKNGAVDSLAAIEGATTSADWVAFSPGAGSAILFSVVANGLQVLSGLPATPRVTLDLDAASTALIPQPNHHGHWNGSLAPAPPRGSDVFRSMKSLLDTRPIYHKCDETIRGHVFCSFLALLLRKELGDRLASKDCHPEWADVVRDLDNLVEMQVAISGKGYVFRGQTSGVAVKVFQACGVALPPTIRSC
ncbi:MAG: hypothetical protein LAQ69_41430 [Acidobacteriia bacterium]|nr:hypothetical protein [Terriglobia bacterium]